MQSAILRVLKDTNGVVYSYPVGAYRQVQIRCGGAPNVIEPVIVDGTFAEYETWAIGRVFAYKIISNCTGIAPVYVLSTLEDLTNLQGCCITNLNYRISISCTPLDGTVGVLDIFGNFLGFANNETEFALLWNASPVNSLVGVLIPLQPPGDWVFILKYYGGSYKPDVLLCTVNFDLVTEDGLDDLTTEDGENLF